MRDTVRFLGEHEQIRVTNERGHAFDIRGKELTKVTKIVVFLGSQMLPADCRKTQYHVSDTAGFIHVLEAQAYLGVIKTLRVPEDIRRYFTYREDVIPKLRDAGVTVHETDIMGAFLGGEDLPTATSRENLRHFVQDLEQSDLSGLIGDIHDHIERSETPHDYYRIMLEFARVPRSVWREIKVRFTESLKVVQQKKFTRPFRLAFPGTDCAFMIAPLDPDAPATGPEGEKLRITGLKNFTFVAMYETKASRAVGILLSKDGDHIQIDWLLLDLPWKQDAEMDKRLAKGSPFGEAKGKVLNSFLFTSPTEVS